MTELVFKEAESSLELRQIHALNHRVFAEEIAQHNLRPSGLLIDRLHHQNRYFIALRDGDVIGMISIHGGPEFSIAKRLSKPNMLAEFHRPAEVRLLAIAPLERNRTVLSGLLWQVHRYAVLNGFSHMLISGIAEREAMYRKLGFRPLGPAVPEGSASFIPMAMEIAQECGDKDRRLLLHKRHWNRISKKKKLVSLMPGPVCIHANVAQAFAVPPMSHRSDEFLNIYGEVKALLNSFTEDMRAAIFPGGGTLANDAERY